TRAYSLARNVSLAISGGSVLDDASITARHRPPGVRALSDARDSPRTLTAAGSTAPLANRMTADARASMPDVNTPASPRDLLSATGGWRLTSWSRRELARWVVKVVRTIRESGRS